MNLLEEIKKGAAFIQYTMLKNSVTNTLVGQLFSWIAELLERLLEGAKFKGYFVDYDRLISKYPSPIVGDIAWVGPFFPGTVWACMVGGAWHDTGAVPQTPTVDLTDYAKKKELDDLNTQLYAEGNEEKIEYLVSTTNTPSTNLKKNSFYYKNDSMLKNAYIHQVELYAQSNGTISILFAKNIEEASYSFNSKIRNVVAGKNIIDIDYQLKPNERIGFGYKTDTTNIVASALSPNPIAGTAIFYDNDTQKWSTSDSVSYLVDLCISVTTLMPATPQGDIQKINNSIVEIKKNYALKVNEENNKVVYAPGGKLPDNIVQVDTKTAPENSLIAKSGNGFKMIDFLALCELYGLSITPANYFIQKLIAHGSIFDSKSIVEKYNSLDPFIMANASAVLFPNAYAKGAVYGMNPRTGDVVPFAFSRITTATYFDKSLSMHSASANMPRIDYGNYSDKAKILIETASTNLLTYSDLSQIQGDASLINIDWFGYLKKGRSFVPGQYAYRASSDPLVGDKVVLSSFVINEDGSIPDMSNSVLANRDASFVMDNSAIAPSEKYTIGNMHRFCLRKTKTSAMPTAYGILKYVTYSKKTVLSSGYQLERRNDDIMSSYIPTEATQVTRSAESLTYTLANSCSVHLKTTKQNVVLDKSAGVWNIHENLNNEGILQLAIFDRILTASEKSQLTA